MDVGLVRHKILNKVIINMDRIRGNSNGITKAIKAMGNKIDKIIKEAGIIVININSNTRVRMIDRTTNVQIMVVVKEIINNLKVKR